MNLIKTKTVKCEMCDNMQPDKSEFRAPHGHTMIVVSIWDEKEKKRRYMDFCSKECVAKWSNAAGQAATAGSANAGRDKVLAAEADLMKAATEFAYQWGRDQTVHPKTYWLELHLAKWGDLARCALAYAECFAAPIDLQPDGRKLERLTPEKREKLVGLVRSPNANLTDSRE